jgi:hypothetical protein
MVETAAKSHRGCNDDGANDQSSHGPTPVDYVINYIGFWNWNGGIFDTLNEVITRGISTTRRSKWLEVRANVYGRKEDCTAKRANLGVTLASAALVF